MPFVEDPAHLSKTRLKSDLVAHNVALPPAASKKEVYVELHLKHIDQKNAANFSSDEDDCVEEVTVCLLLKYKLLSCFVSMPASTRALYERKLQKLLQSDRHKKLNEAAKAVLYSDSEEEENQEEDEESRMIRNGWGFYFFNKILFYSYHNFVLFSVACAGSEKQTRDHVTCRRPIKGAAQRPVQYAYPGSPVSPMTQRTREVERHLVPIHIQILVFLIVACVLYLLYVNVEDC
uniref:LEM-like domain-containing protein n=1 Tax=Amphilophus citrinellus TaxID=61819 RepID=A0A3Q0RUA5_AMPCI